MTINFKTTITLICILTLLLTSSLITVYASSEVTLTVSEVTVEPGTEIDIPVVISGNTNGILAMQLSMTYDERLTFKAIKQGEALSTLDMTPIKDFTANPCTILLDGLDADTSNGTIFILTFAVPSDVTEKLDVNISYNVGEIYDNDMNDVNPKVVNGGIIVKSSIAEPTIKINNLVKNTSNLTLDVNLTSPSDIEGKVIVAIYDENSLLEVKLYNASEATINATLDFVDGDYIKAFWWDFDTYYPFTDCVKVEL